MGAGLVILREGFEASLVVGIVLAFLDRTGRRDAFRPVWIGALAAAVLSAGVAALVAAVALGYVFYRGASRLDLRRFFTVTSSLLLLFAGWLLARGLHELSEAGVLPESTLMLVAAFVALAAPTLYFFLRVSRPQA